MLYTNKCFQFFCFERKVNFFFPCSSTRWSKPIQRCLLVWKFFRRFGCASKGVEGGRDPLFPDTQKLQSVQCEEVFLRCWWRADFCTRTFEVGDPTQCITPFKVSHQGVEMYNVRKGSHPANKPLFDCKKRELRWAPEFAFNHRSARTRWKSMRSPFCDYFLPTSLSFFFFFFLGRKDEREREKEGGDFDNLTT